ncbi:MAG: polysaccharide biosynthesis/export family protein [Usitatibacter sp.]
MKQQQKLSGMGHRVTLFTVTCVFLLPGASFADVALKMSGALDTSRPLVEPVPTPLPVAAPVDGTKLASAPATAVKQVGIRDYRIGPEDLIEIQVFGVEQLTRTVRVNSRGQVSLPLVGTLEFGGLTSTQAEALIVTRLGESYLQNPQVSLFIKEYTSQRVTIEGAVNKPGVYPLRGPTTLLQSLAVAGGQANLSDMTEVMLFRADNSGKRAALTYDVDRIRSGELEDPAVVNDDLIVVKRSKARVFFKDSIIRDMIDTVNPFR